MDKREDQYQEARGKLIVALDISDCEQARALIAELGDEVEFYKIGMELIYHGGLELATELKKDGKKIFIDAKLHDIPRTVLSAARNIEKYGADLLTLHCNASCLAAFEDYKQEPQARTSKMKWCFVTVLTSEDAKDLEAMAIQRKVSDHVEYLAKKATSKQAHGLVASVNEVEMLRKIKGDFLIITPGIRPENAQSDDQKRVATPTKAIQVGSDYLVVGRPIILASDKKQAAHDIIVEIHQAIQAKKQEVQNELDFATEKAKSPAANMVSPRQQITEPYLGTATAII